jgi:hypothetical protein
VIVKGVYTFHTYVEGNFGASLGLTAENCADRHLLHEGRTVVLEFDDDREEWVLVKDEDSGS